MIFVTSLSSTPLKHKLKINRIGFVRAVRYPGLPAESYAPATELESERTAFQKGGVAQE
jgi:hypothetical protein